MPAQTSEATPREIQKALREPPLTASQFTSTEFDDAATKAKFGNRLLRFIAEDFPKQMWNKAFYKRLSMTFGHIAHYNEHGFWGTFFDSRRDKIDFLGQTQSYPCWGDPAFTYSDVEKVVVKRLKDSGALAHHKALLAQNVETAERAEYARLAAKYGPPPAQGSDSSSPLQAEPQSRPRSSRLRP